MVEYYLAAINIFAFFMCGYDKRRAVKRQYRVSENALMMTAVLGGSPGLWCGMMVFRHKTKHKKFTIGVPAILFIEAAAACAIMYLVK